MKRVFASRDWAAIAIVRQLLANEGIDTIIQNENMSALSGEVPFFLAMPEVCIVRDEDEAQALAIVERVESGEGRDQESTKSWTCPRCGEMVEGQFTACWKCGTRMPPTTCPKCRRDPCICSRPPTTKQTVVRLSFAATREQVFKAFPAIANLADKADDNKVKIQVEANAAEGFDQAWLRNAVQEPLDEADIQQS